MGPYKEETKYIASTIPSLKINREAKELSKMRKGIRMHRQTADIFADGETCSPHKS
jgi:hypothetical protein